MDLIVDKDQNAILTLVERSSDRFLTDSYSSWKKGNIENTNKLIRQYIPKGTDISTVTDKRIASIQAKINRRPREKLNFLTPNEVFFKHYN